jgi:hypothetical protein
MNGRDETLVVGYEKRVVRKELRKTVVAAERKKTQLEVGDLTIDINQGRRGVQRVNRQGQGEEVQILKHWAWCIAAGTSQPCLRCLRIPGTRLLWLVGSPWPAFLSHYFQFTYEPHRLPGGSADSTAISPVEAWQSTASTPLVSRLTLRHVRLALHSPILDRSLSE